MDGDKGLRPKSCWKSCHARASSEEIADGTHLFGLDLFSDMQIKKANYDVISERNGTKIDKGKKIIGWLVFPGYDKERWDRRWDARGNPRPVL